MKKIYFLSLILLFLFSCKNENKSSALFSGKVLNSNISKIKVVDYNHSYNEDFPIDNSGNFKAIIPIKKPGTYFFQIGHDYSTVMLKDGYDLHLDIDLKNFYNSIHFTGKGSRLNNFDVSRQHLKAKLVGISRNFFLVPLDVFMQRIDKNKKAFTDLLNKSGLTGDDKRIEEKIIKYDYLLTRNNYDKFVYYYTKKHPVLPADYYDPIKNMNLDDEEAFCFSKSYRILIYENLRYTYNDALKKNPGLSIIDFTKNKIKPIKSALIRDQFVTGLFHTLKQGDPNLDKNYHTILGLLTSQRLKEKLKKRYEAILATKPSQKSVTFNYQNVKGGRTSLEELKGKFVYLDVWATWCGPCRREIPYLMKLIDKYKGKDIAFVSISVDARNDFEKWKKMVTEKHLKGIQLFADSSFKSKFIKFYNISMIPRYILLDRNGKIITPHAPRPSEKKTVSVLDSLLTTSKAGTRIMLKK